MTDQILALHSGIREVFILEERGDRLIVTEEAARGESAILANRFGEAIGASTLAPLLLLGAAGKFGETGGPVRLVGILYANAGVILGRLDEKRMLAISVEVADFHIAMQSVSDAFPALIRELPRKLMGEVKSATVAEEIARAYLARASGSSHVFIDEINFNATNRRWEIHGSYRSSRLAPRRIFQLQIDAEEGAIMSFWSSGSSPLVFLAEVGFFIGVLTLVLLLWLLFSNPLR